MTYATDRERARAWRLVHPDYMRKWRAAHPNYHRDYYAERREQWPKYEESRQRTDPEGYEAQLERWRVQARARYHKRPEVIARRQMLAQRLGTRKERTAARAAESEAYARFGSTEHVSLDIYVALRRSPCVTCGTTPSGVDHIIPQLLGGEHVADNLQPMCQACNGRKSGREELQTIRALALIGLAVLARK